VLVPVSLDGGQRTAVEVCDGAQEPVLTGGGAVAFGHDSTCLVGPAR
jgi:hypothetical protein